MFRNNFVLCAFLFFAFLVTAQEKSSIIPTITVEHVNHDMVAISGSCTNSSSQSKEFKYVLNVQKRSKSGNTNNNTQRGNLYIGPGEIQTLSTTTINFDPEDYTELVLTIFDAANVQIAEHKKLLTMADLLKQ